MGDLSKHFSRAEFRCHCEYNCDMDTVDAKLLVLLEEIRTHFNCVVIINSGNRCALHNRDKGGSEFSQHLLSKAADIVVIGVPADLVQSYFNDAYPNQFGMGRYVNFTHIDARVGRARWGGTTS